MLTIIQIIAPVFSGKEFFFVSVFMAFGINIVAMFLINYNINWLCKKGKKGEAEMYLKNAPCLFQAIKFSIGIILSMALVLINLMYKNCFIAARCNHFYIFAFIVL